MSDPHDLSFTYLIVTGGIGLALLLVYGAYLELRNYRRKRERREQRRAQRKKSKARPRP
ncbi:hypothetical protein [Azohydromonas caseinilytica]|uniref:Heme exporter protein D n=1 Tax=Azohydromonas caseinilytica TaxID=2728836 RepID=A0A848FGW1_9BURK|nr:hypothetical protein [Azohydromonas caseinilytica]NML17081.1 hypothetical protein [Azohydromonas caseinilytica]